MNLRIAASALLPVMFLLGACGNAATPPADGDVVAIVNGKPIDKSEFELYLQNVQRQSQRDLTDAEKSQVLDQFISMKLAVEAAEKAGLTNRKQVQDQLALARMNVILDAGLQKYLEDNPVTEAELKPEYDAQVAALPHEYHARHILVDDKASAEAITKELQEGADFAKLAEQKSKDASAKSGGDLGWFTLDTMVKPFGDAVAALQPGQITAAPVQSQFGWHVIKLEASRPATAPSFEEVKDQVRAIVQRKKLQAYLEQLRKDAKIEKKI